MKMKCVENNGLDGSLTIGKSYDVEISNGRCCLIDNYGYEISTHRSWFVEGNCLDDILKILNEELERKTQQRKGYEQDMIKLKKEVSRLLDIENYLIELRNSVLDDDFREKGDKLILNCKKQRVLVLRMGL